MPHRLCAVLLPVLLLGGCVVSESHSAPAPIPAEAAPAVTVWKAASCGCCGGWVDHMRKAGFPIVLARAFDRGTALQFIRAGVDYQLRETFESALVFGGSTLEALGVDPEEVAEVIEDVRRRDAARFEIQLAEGVRAGQRFLKGNIGTPIPTPLAPPRRAGQALSDETADVLHKSEAQD